MISIGAIFELSNEMAEKLRDRKNEYQEAAKAIPNNKPSIKGKLMIMGQRAGLQAARIEKSWGGSKENEDLKSPKYMATQKDEYLRHTNNLYPDREKQRQTNKENKAINMLPPALRK
jgi:hypothetical protein